MSTHTRTPFDLHATTRWLTFMIALAAIVVSLFLQRAALGQGIGFAGDDPLKYGEMYRTYQREHHQALQDLDDELSAIRRQGNTPGENQQAIDKAFDRFMERSGRLDTRYRQPVVKKMHDVANLRVAEFVKTTLGSPQSTGHVDPSKPITPSKGTQPGQPGYRQGLSDTDAAGGARAVDQLTGIAREMGLMPDDGARLFDLKAGYSTSTDDSLLLTVHKSGRLDRVGSNSWQTQIEVDARSKETSLHIDMQPDQAGRDYVAVRDHQRKALGGLQTSGTELLPEPGQEIKLQGAEKLQGMVKGTLNSLNTAGLSDEALARLIQKHGIGGSPAKLRHVLGLLKGGRAIVPGSVGLTTENIENFKSLCGDIIDESAQVTKAKANAELEERLVRRDQLEATGDKADREQVRKIREEIIDSRKRMQEVERAVVRNEIDDLQKQRDSVAVPTDDAKTPTPSDPETEAARKRRLAEIDREIDTRRAKQAVRDLYADVERRKTVSGTAVVNDLERPRSSRPLPPEFIRRPPPEVPPTQRGGVLTHPVVERGLFVAGGVIATYEGLKEEYYEAEKRLREKRKGTPDENRPLTNRDIMGEVSYTRSAARTALSLTGVEGAWLAGQKAKYEWVKGTNDYIEAEVDRYHRAGYDELPLGASLTIMIKATIRQTTLSVYQGVKGVPILGDLVGFPENLFVLTEAGIGRVYDPWKSDQIEAVNIERGERDAARATLTVGPLVRDIENFATAAALQLRALESMDQSSRDAVVEAEKLRDRFRADFQALETLLEQIGPDVEIPAVVPEAAELGKLLNDITTLIREATEFTGRCDRLERDLQGGKIECSTIREQDQDLSVQFTNLGLSRKLIQEKYASLEKSLQKLGPTADARRLVQRLQETTEYAGRLSENLLRTSRQIPQLVESRRILRANQELLRERVLHYYKVFQPRAAPGSETQEWEDYRRRIDAARIDTSIFKNATVIARRFDVTAQHLGLIARTELPELPVALQPRRADGQLAGDLESLKQPLAAMTTALEKAADKLDGLRQLCPAEKPEFHLATKALGEKTIQFEFTPLRLPAGKKKFVFSWNFGDGTSDVSDERVRQHEYARNGRYEVNVTVYEATEKVSLKIGEASLVVNIGTSETTTPVVAGTPPDESQPHFVMIAVLSPDFDRQGNRVLKDRSGSPPFIAFRVYPASGKVTADFGVRRGFYFEKSGVYEPFYHLTVDGTAEALLEPRSNRIEFATAPLKWEQQVGVYSLGGRVTQEKYGLADAYKRTGVDPTGLRWTGRISGELDWRSGRIGATTGRLDVNALISGDWKIAAVDGLDIGGGRGQWMSPLAVRFYWFRLHPDVATANQVIQANKLAWTSEPFPHDPAHEVFQNNQDALVRIGRWTAKWLKPGPGKQQQYEQLVKFINGPGRQLEQAVPGMADE